MQCSCAYNQKHIQALTKSLCRSLETRHATHSCKRAARNTLIKLGENTNVNTCSISTERNHQELTLQPKTQQLKSRGLPPTSEMQTRIFICESGTVQNLHSAESCNLEFRTTCDGARLQTVSDKNQISMKGRAGLH